MSLATLNEDLPPRGVQAFGMEEEERERGVAKNEALDALSRFIPTELLAPYVAFLAYAIQQQTLRPENIYWGFVVATPIATVFFQYARQAMNNKPWPAINAVIWRAIAATMAFAVWGLAPPGSAFQSGVGGPVVAGLAAIIISPILMGADAIVLRLMRIRKVSK